MIPTCPECGDDLIDEGFDLWCPACQAAVPWTAAVTDTDGDRDD